MAAEDDRLLGVATALAEGHPVSWDETRRTVEPADADVVERLRDLERIARAHRDIAMSFDSTPTTRRVDAPLDSVPPARWGHLEIRRTIGDGSFGTVYVAYDEGLGVEVALKLLFRSADRPGTADEVLREARLLARVRHPNVVRIYGVDDTLDPVGLWMELIQGQTLEDLLDAQGCFGAHEASLIGRDVCRALAAVHGAGIVHGDVKARNVMREEGGRTVLMDFGASRPASDVARDAVGRLIGTPVYLPPEVLDGQPHTRATDIYAVGVLLYHLVTGSYPFTARSLAELRAAHQRGERRRLRDERADLQDDFVQIVEQAIATEPSRRFTSLGALEDALVSVTATVPAARASLAEQAPRRRSLMARWGMGVAAITIAAVAAGIGWARLRTPPAAIATAGAPAASPPPGAAAAGTTYDIDAAFYRVGGGGEQRLRADSRVGPGDELFLDVQASVPVNLYVVNEDEGGQAFLLFPLPGHRLTNPLPAGKRVTVPDGTRWQVTTPGGKEHFIVFASPDPIESLEAAFAELPKPREGAAVVVSLPATAVEQLRGVGGLKAPATTAERIPNLSLLFKAPLADVPERVQGLWVRQITVSNPARR
jgi:hypothetical protein